mmetsp:Transcript_23298/g.50945  ORF Transcript_23298/g.50945 Transcript_23298/m.50945 type:complete len:246 (+) Transcript_23298:861-1598(+)
MDHRSTLPRRVVSWRFDRPFEDLSPLTTRATTRARTATGRARAAIHSSSRSHNNNGNGNHRPPVPAPGSICRLRPTKRTTRIPSTPTKRIRTTMAFGERIRTTTMPTATMPTTRKTTTTATLSTRTTRKAEPTPALPSFGFLPRCNDKNHKSLAVPIRIPPSYNNNNNNHRRCHHPRCCLTRPRRRPHPSFIFRHSDSGSNAGSRGATRRRTRTPSRPPLSGRSWEWPALWRASASVGTAVFQTS